jgi:hypothetical protein
MRGVLAALYQDPPLSSSITLDCVTSLIEALQWLRPQISLHQPSFITSPPLDLPDNYTTFIQQSFDLTEGEVSLLWSRLRDYVWAEPISASKRPTVLLLGRLIEHGLPLPVKTRIGTSSSSRLRHSD